LARGGRHVEQAELLGDIWMQEAFPPGRRGYYNMQLMGFASLSLLKITEKRH